MRLVESVMADGPPGSLDGDAVKATMAWKNGDPWALTMSRTWRIVDM